MVAEPGVERLTQRVGLAALGASEAADRGLYTSLLRY